MERARKPTQADCDEWAQITILGVLARYLRTQFVDPSPDKPQTSSEPQRIVRRKVKKAFYSDDEDESEEEVVVQDDPWDDDGPALEDDHKLALTSSLPLLKSRNSGVVLAVCSLHYHCGAPTNEERETIGRALVRILRNRPEIQYVVLKSIAVMASERPVRRGVRIASKSQERPPSAFSDGDESRRRRERARNPRQHAKPPLRRASTAGST